MKIENLDQALNAASAGIGMVISILTGSVIGYAGVRFFDEGSSHIDLVIAAVLGPILGTS